jgi:hypothetical protein
MGFGRAQADGVARVRTRLAWRRALVLALPLVYVVEAAVRSDVVSARRWAGLGLSVVVALLGARVRDGETSARGRARALMAAALSLTVAGASLNVAWTYLAFARAATLLGANVVMLRALLAIEGEPGLAARATEALAARTLSPRQIVRIGVVTTSILWVIVALSAALPGLALSLVPLRLEVLSVWATVVTMSISCVAALVVAKVRHLELGAWPRALASAAVVGGALLIGAGLTAARVLRADVAFALASALAAPAFVRICYARDALLVARRGRLFVTLAVFGLPVVALASVASEGRGVGVAGGLVALLTMVIGVFSRQLQTPFLPDQGRLLEALADAMRFSRDRESRSAIASVLVRLRDSAGYEAPSPELWLLHSNACFTVDTAGYLQQKVSEIPAELLRLAHAERGHTLRVDVLRALEVRGADVRPLLRWMEDRGAFFASIIAEGLEPDGVLIVPRGTRTAPVQLEEVEAAKLLADAFVTVCQAEAARTRHLERERLLTARLDALDDELATLRYEASLDASRNMLASSRLARPATVGVYSASARLAYEAIERRVHLGAPVVVVARAGIDPVPYVARAHLTGPRRERPLVIVDGTASSEHELERWRDERVSPLALADRGLFVLVDAPALPVAIQVLVARALMERRPPWERASPLELCVALTATATPEELRRTGLLTSELFSWFEDATPIELTRLHERAEDLFSIVSDRLAREGLRVHGAPIGIEAAAFACLVEHPFDGEDHELASIVTRLVQHVRGDVVRLADVEALRLEDPKSA